MPASRRPDVYAIFCMMLVESRKGIVHRSKLTQAVPSDLICIANAYLVQSQCEWHDATNPSANSNSSNYVVSNITLTMKEQLSRAALICRSHI